MKLLIIGSKGQLGSELVKKCKRNEFSYLALDLPEFNISDPPQVEKTLADFKPSIVINASAYTNVDKAETEPEIAFSVNSDGPANLAVSCDKNRIPIIHVSTDYVFDGSKGQPYSESDPVSPLGVYGKSKEEGESKLRSILKQHIILRTSWLYGAYGNNFVKTMLRLTLQNPGKEFKVVADQYGSPTGSHTLARQIRAVVEKQATGIFHATSEGYCTWYDLACAFLEGLGVEHNFVPCSTDEFPTPTKRPANSILENARLKDQGINVFKDWKVELTDFVSQNGNTILAEIREMIGS